MYPFPFVREKALEKSMKRSLRVGWVALLAVLAHSESSRADVAPDPSYVESCTLEQQKQSGDECLECRASFQDPEACRTEHATGGFAQRCRTRGASVWTEIWCRVKPSGENGGEQGFAEPPPGDEPAQLATNDSAPAPLAPPEKRGSCGACSVGAPSHPDATLALLLASAMLLGRRRPRAR